MGKIPFKVSARAARLIGRENVANAEGAIVELVKNGYDADATVVVVFFDNKYSQIQEEFSNEEFHNLISEESHEIQVILKDCYLPQPNGNFQLDEEIPDNLWHFVNNHFKSKGSIYIIDSGIGMTKEVIEEYWMTIGTDNKETTAMSDWGRIKTGAKGIGRFALDRLGEQCEMITKTIYGESIEIENRKVNDIPGYSWKINWNDFEGDKKSIETVNADLEVIGSVDIQSRISKILGDFSEKDDIISKFNCNSGTILKISKIRDEWSDISVNKIYSSLENLIPPREDQSFKIFVLSSLYPNKYGEVESIILDQYDYRLTAKYKKDHSTNIKIYRNELLYKKIDPDVYRLDRMMNEQFHPRTFETGKYSYTKTIEELLPGLPDTFKKYKLDKIGEFEFNFYFLKMGEGPSERGTSKFPYKGVDLNSRRQWLTKFGGIKLYRDGFRVRPYGEPSGNSFDWLGLGQRSSKSPTVTKAGYKVRPNQVYGIINISRLENIDFNDKSSREGIQENPVFSVFRDLIIKLIGEFEKDRNYVMMSIKEVFDRKDEEEILKNKADKIIEKVNKSDKQPEDKCEEEKQVLVRTVEHYKDKIESFEEEQMLLRVLASTGLIITSFAHELKNLTDRIVPRTAKLKEILNNVTDKAKVDNLKDFENPYVMLEDFRNQDTRLSGWLGFSLAAVQKEKRKQKRIELISYLKELERLWHTTMDSRGIELIIKRDYFLELYIDGNPIDFDAIFNNLITNSIDAFKRKNKNGSTERKIIISFQISQNIDIKYEDTGPGLADEIIDPYWILNPYNTTKRNEEGEETGTGLGMYIVKHVIDQYDGDLEIIDERPGFKLKMRIPTSRTNE